MGDLAEPVVTAVGLRILILLIFGGVLLASVYSQSENPLALNVNSLLLAATLFFNVLYEFVQIDALRSLALFSNLIFLIVIVVSMLQRILVARRVSIDLVFSSVCVYLILGVCWSMIYSLLELANPGSFSISADSSVLAGETSTSIHSLYFSFVTLTTLGYGDVSPTTSPARFFTVLESLTGQIYLAVLVARLVGLQIANAANDGTPKHSE